MPTAEAAVQGKRIPSWEGALAGLATGIVAVIGSWYPSLWSDEAATISAAQRSLSDLSGMLGQIDLVHGFYYFVMHWWIGLFGPSAFSIRMPSAVAVAVAGACVYWLAAQWRGRSFAIWSAVLFALMPRLFWAGMEGRAYAFTGMFAVAATLLLVVALRSDRKIAWIGYALLMLGGVLSNLYVILLVAAHLVSVFWDRGLTRVQRIAWFITAGSTVVVVAPFLLAAYRQAGQLSDRQFSVRDLIQNVAVNQWFLGDTPTTTGGTRTSFSPGDFGSWWLPAGLLLAAASWALMIYAIVRYRGALVGRYDGNSSLLVWLLPWLVLPTAVVGLYSVLATPMYGPRYLTFAAPAVAMLIALGLTAIPTKWLRTAGIGILIVAAIPVYVSQRQLYAKNSSDWVSVADYIGGSARPGDGVYFAPRYDVGGDTVGQTTRGIMVAYPDNFQGLVDVTLIDSAIDEDNLVGESRYIQESEEQLKQLDRVWVIRRTDYPQSDADTDDAFLARQGFMETAAWTGPLDVVLTFERVSG